MPYLARPLLIAAIAATPFPRSRWTRSGRLPTRRWARFCLFFADADLLGADHVLGMASPFAVRLGVTTVEKSGEVAGRMYARRRLEATWHLHPGGGADPGHRHAADDALHGGRAGAGGRAALGRRYLPAPAAIIALALLLPGS
jgi:hypothetical protein